MTRNSIELPDDVARLQAALRDVIALLDHEDRYDQGHGHWVSTGLIRNTIRTAIDRKDRS